nr:hypothetical protein [uncultured Acetatifactor sp.]
MEMNIGIAVFAYNRSRHLQQVLFGLHKNESVKEIYIFQDGLRCENHRTEWEKVRKVINGITWCKTICFFSSYNKGLACSVTEGIETVLREKDAVIVLEDDCVPTVNYIGFMRQCFERYADDEKIYSVSGYSYPVALKRGQYDIYGCGRISSWGWGTWKNRWDAYIKDYELIKKMKRSRESSRNLAMWGRDLEEMLVGNVRGSCDSWAVFWALNVISKGGVCINPYESLIQNIGLDGSGTNCGTTNLYEVSCIDEKKKVFSLPDTVTVLDETAEAFVPFFGSYTAVNTDSDKEKVFVYGVGNYFSKKEKLLNQDYYIEKFIDRNKKGYFAGKEIVAPDELRSCSSEKIVVMIQDEKESANVVHELINHYGISGDKIELGIARYS